MLKLGSFDNIQIRSVYVDFGCDLKILYISDLHFSRWTTHIAEQLNHVCEETSPDVILLGGDLVDSTTGLSLLEQFIRAQSCPVYAIDGNHDRMIGLDKVQHSVIDAGGIWLGEPIRIHRTLSISGIYEVSPTKYSILCAHDPAVFPQAIHHGYDLTLAGHLHGGQIILTEQNGRFYPGALLSEWTGDVFTCGKSKMIVSKGVHDTIPIRWNCPREVILCYC